MKEIDKINKETGKINLENKTFMDALNPDDIESVKLYCLLLSGLNQMSTAKEEIEEIEDSDRHRLIKIQKSPELENAYRKAIKSNDKSDDKKTRDIIYEYEQLKNIQYLVDLGLSSTLRFTNDLRTINVSGHYRKDFTLWYIIESYISLTEEEKQVLILNRKSGIKNNNDLLFNLLIKIQKAIRYIYPIEIKNGIVNRLNNLKMLGEVSALLKVASKTLNIVNPINHDKGLNASNPTDYDKT